MISTQPGGQGQSPRSSPAEKARRLYDEAAYAAARERVKAECLALLLVLHCPDSPLALVARQAQEAARAAGMTWETASRLLGG